MDANGRTTDPSFDDVLYIGSIRIVTMQHSDRLELIHQHMIKHRVFTRAKPISITVSLSGIKICSPDRTVVYMAHALRRISYATCDLRHNQFCFLAREPRGHFSSQYCHLFSTKSSQQADELNSIVGSAFRMAYTAQLNKQTARLEDKKDSIGDDQAAICWSKIAANGQNVPKNNEIDERPSIGRQRYQQYHRHQEQQQQQQHQTHQSASDGGGGLYKFPPNTIPGLSTMTTFNNNNNRNSSNESTPTSDESNSPTELNMYKRLLDKPPLVKRIPFANNNNKHTNLHPDNNNNNNNNNNSNNNKTQIPNSVRPNPEGCLSSIHKEGSNSVTTTDHPDDAMTASLQQLNSYTAYNDRRLADSCAYRQSQLSTSNSVSTSIKSISDYSSSDSENCSQNTLSSQCCSPLLQSSHTPSPVVSLSNSNNSSNNNNNRNNNSSPTAPPPPPPPPPPPLPLSLISEREKIYSARQKEENELRSAPWFQAGIPREITLEVLSQEPIGAFMVRESTTKPGCFALSVRVPREFHTRGIAHYLILKTNKGYKIKGFTKEFSTLTALITHHSVMQELLPCPLSLSRYNPSFTKTDTSKDFADIDSDPDYNTLADFRKMMADLKI